MFFTVWTLCGSMWTHCGKLMSQSGNFLHSVGTMWIYVNTLWWINATEWQFASQCGHYVALCEHTVVNSVHCCDYVNTVWISLSHSEGANSYTSVDIFTLWQLYGLFRRLVDMSLKIQIQYFSELFIIFSPSYMIVSGTKNKKFIFIRLLWEKMVKSCVFHSVPKYKKNSEKWNMAYYHFIIATSYHFIHFWILEESNYLQYTTAFQVIL